MPIKHHSPDKMTEIYDTYYLPIYRFVYYRVGDTDSACDITADVFQKFLTAVVEKHENIKNVSAWLYRTAHNTVVDFYRRQSHRRHQPLQDSLVDTSSDPVETAERRIEAEVVRLAVAALTPDQQAVISLKFGQGMSNLETAEMMEKPITAIKSLQHRALVALRRQLTRTGEGLP